MYLRLLPVLLLTALLGCHSTPKEYKALPEESIDTVQVVYGQNIKTRTERGYVDIELSKADPSITFYNNPRSETDAWGAIILFDVSDDGTVTVQVRGQEASAKPGQVLPGTGIMVMTSDPAAGETVLRSRWSHTIKGEAF